MGNIKFNIPKLEFTPVDNKFIDKYLPEAKGEFVKVYLICLRYALSNMDTSIEDISQTLGLLQTDVIKAFEYWEEKGLLHLSNDGTLEFLDESMQIKNNNLYLNDFSKDMLEHIEKLIGRPLYSKEILTYMNFLDDFNFTPEVILLLVEYCAAKKKTDIRYIEKVAIAWHDSGVKSIEDAQKQIKMREDKWNKYRAIASYLGFKDSEISKPQEEFMEKWLFKMGFPLEIVLEACRICIMRINEGNFNYIDAILSDWYKNGVKKVEDLNKLSKKSRKKSQPFNKIQNFESQYDMAELKRQLLGRGDSNEK
ncbi:DnaD domain protein [Caloramator sp. E03]|uniref:DnaD domain protein n=1 Tax=Caloramator sp. E03 TaxID=2576307 RepID=UPI0011103B16|nr:DnaD domain protein [Caloramator sp. E03]QCX33649.1 DnaD domain protein [Caloramator sp. E03]